MQRLHYGKTSEAIEKTIALMRAPVNGHLLVIEVDTLTRLDGGYR